VIGLFLAKSSSAEAFETSMWGSRLLVGDLDGMGPDDLAVGAPGALGGRVRILFGASGGVYAKRGRTWSQASPGVRGRQDGYDFFGGSLGIANFGGGRHQDLAISSVGEALTGSGRSAGVVHVLYGSRKRLTVRRDDLGSQRTPGVPGRARGGHYFGFSLLGLSFGRGHQADLAIGIPGDDVATVDESGSVVVLYGTANGLTVEAIQRFSAGRDGLVGTADSGDSFGFALRGFH
jgi:hypothetical protein